MSPSRSIKSPEKPELKEAPGTQRLAKYLALAGVASRRHAERIVHDGVVTVNGRVITDPAFSVSDEDAVFVDGRAVNPPSLGEHVYVMFHKPVGVVSTMSAGAEPGPILSDMVEVGVRLHPIGRLDRDSSGLILMTNDGELTLKLTHPSHMVEKEYLVKIHRLLHPKEVERVARGIPIDERPVAVSEFYQDRGGRWRIVIHEGRNRIVRRLFGAMNCKVLELKRLRIGTLSLGKLAIGKWRKLTPKEISSLKESLDNAKGTLHRRVLSRPVRRERPS